jgi:autotransporter-associated beta strand protein
MKNFTKKATATLLMLFALTTGAFALDVTLTNGQDYNIALTNAGTLNVTVATGNTATISGLISGTCNLTKLGEGTLIITANNTFSGSVTITEGTLQLGNGGTTGSLGTNITGITISKARQFKTGGTSGTAGYLVIDRTGTTSREINCVISDVQTGTGTGSYQTVGGTVTKRAGGLWLLKGNNTYTAATIVEAGTLRIGNATTTGAVAGNISVASGAYLSFGRSNAYTYAGRISGEGAVSQEGAGTLTLGSANTYTGKTTVSGGHLIVADGGSIASSSEIAVSSGKTLQIDNSTEITYAMPITGAGGLVKAGTGKLNLTGDLSYTGPTDIQDGTLSIRSTLASSNVVNNGNYLDITVSEGEFTYAGVISGSGALSKWGAGKLILTANNSYTGNTYVQENSVLQINGSIGSTNSVQVKAGGELIFNPSATTPFSKVISGAGKVTKKGSAVLNFTADNTYTGVTTVEAGTLNIGAGTPAGKVAGNIVLSSANSSVGFGRSTAYTYSGVISGTGKVNVGASLTFDGANTYEGTTSLKNATLTLGTNGTIANSSQVYLGSTVAKLAISGNKSIRSLSSEYADAEVILGNYTLTINETGNQTYAGKFTATTSTQGGITKLETGTLKLTGASSSFGSLFLSGGAVEFSAANSLGTNVYFNGGTLKWASGSTADISAKIMAVRSGGATFDTNGNDVTFATSFPTSSTPTNTTGAVTKTGAGKLAFNQAAIYTGATNVNVGTLDIGGTAGEITSSSIVLAENVTLACSRSTDYTYGGRISGAGKMKNTNGKLTLTGTNTFTGGTLTESNLQIGVSGATGRIAGNIEVTAGDTVTFAHNSETSLTYSGIILGAGTLCKAGASTLTLSGANTYTGATAIAAGTLKLDATGTIAASSGVTITGASGKFQIEADKTVRGLESAQSGSQVVINSGVLTVANITAQTFAGVISGSGGFTKTGTNLVGSYFTYTLTNANTYTGTTTVENSRLVLAAGGSIAHSQNIVLSKMNPTPGTVTQGSLDITAGNKTIQNLNTEYTYSTVYLGSNTLTIGTGTSSGDGGGTFKGKFDGTSGKVTKTGFLPLTLSGVSTATGNLSHTAGTIILANGATWAGNYAQNSGATLEVGGNISFGGTFTLAGGGTINMDLTAATPAKINVGGAATLTTGTTTMNVTAATGNYTLIEAASGVNNVQRFSFANIPGLTLTPTLGTDGGKTQLKLGVATTDATAPTAGAGVNAGTPTAETIPLTWEAGNDLVTTVANLHYSVYQSSSNNITTVANCEVNGTLLTSGNNFTSHTATGLMPNTTYYFNVVVKDQSNNKAAYTPVSVKTAKATLGGTVYQIVEQYSVGGQLKVDDRNLTSNPAIADLGAITYQWKRGATNIGTNSNIYNFVAADVNNTITVTITTANTQGSVSYTTPTIQKAAQAAPAAPTLASKTHNSITLTAITGAEYRRSDLATWQDGVQFTGLTPETDYQFYARLKETATHFASPESPISAVITTNVAPAVTAVTVSPATASVQKGNTQQFSANVTAVGGAATTVTWSIVGTHHANTTISTSGLLTVAAAETANSLQVKATSTFNTAISGMSSVTLTTAPAVTAVEVSATDDEVLKGQSLQFTANVTAEGGASTAVNWTIVGAHHASTTINASGLLSVNAAETATSLTVRATSTFNPAKYDELTVSVLDIPAVNSVTVTPATVSVQKGQTQQFAVTVDAKGGADASVTWSIVETHSAGTTISSSGLLTVAAAETATTLTVRATSVFNTSKYGNATITVTTVPVTPEVTTVTIDPTAATVQKGSSKQFTHTIQAVGGASTAVTWSVTGASAATVSNTGLLTVPANETASSITVKVMSNFNTAKFATATVTLTAAPVVNSVTVSPATTTVQKGQSQQFTANVSVSGGASNAVTWTVEGANDAGTDIDGTGFLTVAAGETASSLTVKATSNFDSQKVGSATVTLTAAPAVNSVTVSPATVNVPRTTTQQFSATVDAVGGASTDVTWSVEGASVAGTTISASGLLTIPADEWNMYITVKATSVFNTTKVGTATVQVTAAPTVNNVAVSPPTASVQKGQTQQFTANVSTTNGASTAVTWSVSGAINAGTTINTSGLLTVATAESADEITVTATSVFDGLKSGSATVTLTAAPAVTAVSINPASASVMKGNAQQFTAEVTAVGGANAAVTWTVEGASASTISGTGLLQVGAGETATAITVKATSVFNTAIVATATVTITDVPAVTSISISPTTASVQKGATLSFLHEITTVGGASNAVTWSVEDAANAATVITNTGMLMVSAEETASTVTVTVTSVFDGSKSASASVTITGETSIEEITAEESDNTLKLWLENGKLRITNYKLREGENVQIFDISGKVILNSQFSVFNSIDVSYLAEGVYLVKTGNYAGKFVKK